MYRFFALLFLAFATLLPGDVSALFQFRGPHRLEIGPEWYYMTRSRKGGSKQSGNLLGARIQYDRIRRSALYWALEAYYAEGRLNGSKEGVKIKSDKRDSEFEGRLGYTLKKHFCYDLWFVPYFGGGFFQGTNKFISPSPITYKIRNQFPFVSLGFLTRCDFNSKWRVGLNFKTKLMIGARSKIIDDPDFGDQHLIIEDKPCFEVELPITYRFCGRDQGVQLSLTPFYRFRRYGSHENFPFDYIDTRFQIGGLRIMAAYLF